MGCAASNEPREAPIKPPKETPAIFHTGAVESCDYAILRFYKGSLYSSEIPDPVLYKLVTQCAMSTGSIRLATTRTFDYSRRRRSCRRTRNVCTGKNAIGKREQLAPDDTRRRTRLSVLLFSDELEHEIIYRINIDLHLLLRFVRGFGLGYNANFICRHVIEIDMDMHPSLVV
ncbi:unnamed protein product [Amoebophrya sp. A25]|nr:unnamed protein product [Amoebophrya sp. A25]|eukprot:GSA25T00025232001.1